MSRSLRPVDVALGAAALGLVVGLALPAVQAARVEANLKASQDNLRKIAAATLEHEKAVGRLPFGTYHDNNQAGGSADPRFNTFYSGFVAILPYLGEEKLYRVYDPIASPDSDADADGDGWSNKKITESRPAIFVDPSMPAPEAPPSPGWSSYSWCGGNNDVSRLNGGNLTGGSGGTHDGAIVNAKQGGVSLSHVTDGPGYTFLVGDSHYTLTGLTHPKNSKEFAGKPLTGNTVWGRGHYPRGYLSTNTPPNTHASKHSNPNMADWYEQGAFGFRSVHKGGVNFAFCDGSVRLVSEKIPLAVYKALGSRAGGEVLAESDLAEAK